jgi:hypothetical protein
MPGDRWASVRLAVPARGVEARARFATQVLDWLRRELARGNQRVDPEEPMEDRG